MPRKRKTSKSIQPSKGPPTDIRLLLGSPPLLNGEDAGAYDALYDRILETVRPKDVLEEIWVRDVIDLIWETLRLRRLKTALMKAASHEGLRTILEDLNGPFGFVGTDESVGGWMRGDQKVVRAVESQLKKVGLDHDSIAAQTLVGKLDTFEKIDRLIAQTELRRNAILRELDRHRSVLADRMRALGRDIEDAEFVEVGASAEGR